MRLATTAFVTITFLITVSRHQISCSKMPFSKIIGGTYAEYGEFPYQLSVEYFYPRMEIYVPFCGAAAISNSWALTAAHCIVDEGQLLLPEEVVLRSGTLEKGQNGSVHSVEKIVVHHKYNEEEQMESQLDFDISLLKVKEKFSTNPYVKFVHLPRQGLRLKPGTSVTAVGWGMIDADMSEMSPLLKKTVLAVLERKSCENMPHFRWELRISKHMICAAAIDTDTAPGDSGGPLVTIDGTKHTQVGIVSWGSGTGQMSDPGIYTKVSVFRLWINMKSGV